MIPRDNNYNKAHCYLLLSWARFRLREQIVSEKKKESERRLYNLPADSFALLCHEPSFLARGSDGGSSWSGGKDGLQNDHAKARYT